MKKQSLVLIGLLCSCFAAIASGGKDYNQNLVGVGGQAVVGPDVTAGVATVAYERTLKANLAIFVKAGTMSWEYDDGYYYEEGDGTGMEVGISWYPSWEGLEGFYIGIGGGIWQTEWDWEEDYSRGSGDTTSFEGFGRVGYRFILGGNFFLEPSVQLGSWFGSESELGAYVTPGLSLGATF